ncbi:nitroreductase family protein [Clostridium estertheticum]|uniref:nitroreductase family protein n=1 Tax=Clostridium estertheticum TaxID=238834 RepID=UPI0013EEBF44|nr:nitroreductase family protein [Clostridium estertheticum]MBZ9606914.1 nitroreductase family protein [Clostridium estertheticum]
MIQAINLRKSIRNYKDKKISGEHLQEIKTIINDAKPLFDNIPMEVLLIEDGEKITDTFKGLISKYTKVKAPHYLAFTSEIKESHLENIGFIGEEIVLKLTELGIGTCWLGSAIKQELFKTIFKVKDKQSYIILVAFGYPTSQLKPVVNRKRFDKIKLVTGAYENQYETIIQSLIDAPSAINSQPWKLSINNNKFDLYLDNRNILTKKMLKDTNRIDMGIGLSHLYNSAIELGYKVELKQSYHDVGNSLYILSAILNKS